MTDIYIFGAHSRARTFAVYWRALEKREIKAFLVDNDEPNETKIDGIPVMRLTDASLLDKACTVYLAVRSIHHAKITDRLKADGIKNVIPVSPELDSDMRNRFFRLYCSRQGMAFEKFEDDAVDPSACIYVAQSVHDKLIPASVYQLQSYEKKIQVGTVLTDERLEDAAYFDDDGDNISAKNEQFCEETALYWMWKHSREDIVGLCHYRRHFILPEDWRVRMEEHNVDVILPTPLYLAPSLRDNFRYRHDSSHWDFMMGFLRGRSAEEYQSAEEYYSGNLFCPCNMFIMRRAILKKYCEWLFPILFAAAEHGGQKKDPYRNRYPGFLAEWLLSWYFHSHEEYRVVYADKNFLE